MIEREPGSTMEVLGIQTLVRAGTWGGGGGNEKGKVESVAINAVQSVESSEKHRCAGMCRDM